jgi:hypothetical protein
VRKARAANPPAFEAETSAGASSAHWLPQSLHCPRQSVIVVCHVLFQTILDIAIEFWCHGMPGPSTSFRALDYHLFGTGILKSWSQARIRFHLCHPSIVPNDTALAPIKLVAVSMSSPVSHVMSFRSLDAYFLPNFLLLLFELLKCS